MKILVFNVKYSENLGDGILAQCIENALTMEAGTQVETIDLAGRTGFGTTHQHRQYAIHVLHALPSFARSLAVTFILRPKLEKLEKEWSRKLASVDAVVLGGGNLFQDDDLNFPLKIGTLLDCVRRSGKPLAIYAVGVGEDWSAKAHELFGVIRQTDLVHLSVRDGKALENWNKHFQEGPSPVIVPDPGLLAARFLEREEELDRTGGKVGICVTDPVILMRHAGRRSTDICFRTAAEYRDLIRLLVRQGYSVRLFTNGAREDQRFAEKILDDEDMILYRTTGVIDLIERPQVPEDIIDILRSLSVIVAHRLHACIAAYSLGVPHVGLGWDSKVASFFRSVGREAYFASGKTATPAHVAALVTAAETSGIDPDRHGATLLEALEGVRGMQNNF
ncbi:polysaccharide pyruvyl transferase family protein [Rhizobium daejeonense]